MLKKSKRINYTLNLVSGFSGTITSILIGFATVPISVNYWHTDRYGLWILIISISTYLSLSNLGLNSVATILMTKNPNVSSKLLIFKRTFYILILSVSTFLIAFILLSLYNRGWISVLGKIPDNLKDEAFRTCTVLGLFFFINLPFSLITSGFQAFQKLYIDNLFSLGSIIINFINLLIVIFLKGNLTTFAIITGLSTLSFNIIKLLFFYFYVYKKIPKHSISISIGSSTDPETSYRIILKTSFKFFLIVTATMIVINTDYIIISNFLGVSKITAYSVTLRVFQIVNSLILLSTASLFPIIAKEFGENNWNWINDIFNKALVLMSIIGGLIWIGGILFVKDFIFIWTGEIGYAGITTVFFLGGYSYLLSMINLNAGLMTSFNYLYPIFSWFEAILKVGFSILLLKYFDIAGVAMGTFFSSLLSASWLLPLFIIKRSKKRIHFNIKNLIRQFLVILLPCLILSLIIQLFIDQFFFKVFLSFIVLSIYLLLSYKIAPYEVKAIIAGSFVKIKSML